MTQPFDGTTRPEGSDEAEWKDFIFHNIDRRDFYIFMGREISAAIEAAVAREREAILAIVKSHSRSHPTAIIPLIERRARGKP